MRCEEGGARCEEGGARCEEGGARCEEGGARWNNHGLAIYTCSISCEVTELIKKEALALFTNSCTAVFSEYNYTSC